MKKYTWWGKTLRFVGILLMGVTALFTLAGGLGTTCVALNPTGFGESMAKLAPFQWLYILFVIVTTGVGIMAARAVFLLVKGRPNSFRFSVTALILGIVVGGIHMLVSRALRGKSMPVDGVVYTTVLTLIVFLLFRIPTIWQGLGFTTGSDDHISRLAASMTLLVTGVLTFTVQHWAGPSHSWDGTNWAAAFSVTTLLLGLGQLTAGVALFLLPGKTRKTASRPIIQG